MTLQVLEHREHGYAPRTRLNARSADLTVAFALDFSTPGERLTHKAAGERYRAIDLALPAVDAARLLYAAARKHQAKTVNVAGNGIYTLAQHGWTQERANAHLVDVLGLVHQHWGIERVISGGQTGIDIAGIVAACHLGIDAIATLPRGFIQRGADRRDQERSAEQIKAEVLAWSEQLSSRQAQREAPR